MRLFIVHETARRKLARDALEKALRSKYIEPEMFFLEQSYGSEWQGRASSEIESSEAVVVFRQKDLPLTDNMTWEVEEAKRQGKRVLDFIHNDNNVTTINALQALYDFTDDFERCFEGIKAHEHSSGVLDLYRIMVETSEALVQRRLLTNTFFFGAVSAVTGAAGYLAVAGYLFDLKAFVLIILFAVNLMICRSWSNLIKNYGRLNRAKFRVINRLEQNLASQIFSAEWIALGKGLRPALYQSFTSSEGNVPRYFFWASVPLVVVSTGFFSFNLYQAAAAKLHSARPGYSATTQTKCPC